MTIGRVNIALDANAQRLVSDFRQAEFATNRFARNANAGLMTTQRRFESLNSSAMVLRQTLVAGLGTLGIGLGGTALVRQVRSIVAEVSELGKQARAIGLSAEALQKLRFGFELTGVAAQQTSQHLATFAQRLGQAESRGGELADILAANGVAMRDVEGNARPLLDLLRDYADLIKNADSEQQALALSAAAFGRTGGSQMVRALRDGSAGVDELMRKAKAAGVVIGEDLVDAAERIDDRFATLSRRIGVSFKSAVLTAVDAVDIMIERFRSLENRTLLAPLHGSLEALNDERDAINSVLETQREILRHDPSDPAAQRSVEIALERLKEIEAQSAAVLNQIAEAERQVRDRPRGPGVAFDDDDTGGGRAGRRIEERANAYERLTESIRRNIDALELEVGLVGKSAEEAEAARTAFELLNAAKEAGIPITADLQDEVAQLAEEYAAAVVELDQLTERMREQEAAAHDAAAAVASFAGDLITDFGNAEEAAKRLLKRILDIILQLLVLGPLQRSLSGAFGFAGGGRVGFAQGGRVHGPGTETSDSIPARLSRGEFVVNARATRRHLPLLHAINRGAPGFAGGGFVPQIPAPKLPAMSLPNLPAAVVKPDVNIRVDTTAIPGATGEVSQGPGGEIEVIVKMLEGRMAKSVASGGQLGSIIEQAFGLRRKPRS